MTASGKVPFLRSLLCAGLALIQFYGKLMWALFEINKNKFKGEKGKRSIKSEIILFERACPLEMEKGSNLAPRNGG